MNTTRRSVIAVGFGAGIGVLGGLIGLGGGEFRLPVLTSGFGYSARAAVPMNLIVSPITLATSLAIRAETLSFAPVGPYVVEVAALGVGGMVGARWSARLLTRLSDHRLEYAIAALLAAIGVLLIVEAFLPAGPAGLVTRDPVWLRRRHPHRRHRQPNDFPCHGRERPLALRTPWCAARTGCCSDRGGADGDWLDRRRDHRGNACRHPPGAIPQGVPRPGPHRCRQQRLLGPPSWLTRPLPCVARRASRNDRRKRHSGLSGSVAVPSASARPIALAHSATAKE